MLRIASILLALSVLAMTEGQSCDQSNPCPTSTPCCSPYGFCGAGSFCQGGCNALASHALSSCMPMPICKSGTSTFNDMSRIINEQDFDGDVTAYDWTLDGGDIKIVNGALEMQLTKTNGGTKISSTRYIHYGSFSASIKTGRWPGVVAAFITMSNVKDEIDWEFPGNSTTSGQTNFFWQGVITQPTHGFIAKGIQDTYTNYNSFSVNWQPDQMVFSVNGKTVRTVKASDYVEGGIMKYPNTPSRVQLSLWPAGTNSSAPGTIQWAGGLIDWSHPDYVTNGHFSASVKSVTIKCADSFGSNVTSYTYGTNSSSMTPSVRTSSASTILNSKSSSNGGKSSIFTTSVIIGMVAGAIAALIILALLVRICSRRRSRRVVPVVGPAYDKSAGQTYQPLQENHSMPSIGYQQQPGVYQPFPPHQGAYNSNVQHPAWVSR